MNLPLVEDLEQMPRYIKFISDFVKKNKIMSMKPMDYVHHCSAIGFRSLVEKKEDLGEFTVLCTIGCFNFVEALCYLGARINMILLVFYN